MSRPTLNVLTAAAASDPEKLPVVEKLTTSLAKLATHAGPVDPTRIVPAAPLTSHRLAAPLGPATAPLIVALPSVLPPAAPSSVRLAPKLPGSIGPAARTVLPL